MQIAAAAVDIPQSATLHFDKIQKVMTIAEFQAFYDSAGVKTRKGQVKWWILNYKYDKNKNNFLKLFLIYRSTGSSWFKHFLPQVLLRLTVQNKS